MTQALGVAERRDEGSFDECVVLRPIGIMMMFEQGAMLP